MEASGNGLFVEVTKGGKVKRFIKWLLGKGKLDFVGVLRLTPGDVLCVRYQGHLEPEEVDVIKESIATVLEHRNNVLVLDSKWTMQVLRGYEKEAEAIESGG
jgi:hypothetical protein